MKDFFAALIKFGDVETLYGLFSALAAPIVMMFMVALMSIAQFGVLAPPLTPADATGQATKVIADIAKDTPKDSIASFYFWRDGTVETRTVLRTANSSAVFRGPITNLIFMVVSAIACFVCGGAVTLRLVSKAVDPSGTEAAVVTYRVVRQAARVVSVGCLIFTLWALWTLGFGATLGWLWENAR